MDKDLQIVVDDITENGIPPHLDREQERLMEWFTNDKLKRLTSKGKFFMTRAPVRWLPHEPT